MNEQALSHLRDLHLPAPIGAWPIAYGWYFVIAFCLFGLFTLSYFIYRLYQSKKPKKLALKKLQEISAQYQKDKNANRCAYEISKLIKQLMMVYQPRKDVAALHGDSWLKAIGQPSWGEKISQLNYQAKSDENIQSLFPEIMQWIKQWPKTQGGKDV